MARNQALRLRAWNQKAYAAQLALGTLATLERPLLPGECARFVAHIYDELTDLSQAYAGESWHPMFVVVAHDDEHRFAMPGACARHCEVSDDSVSTPVCRASIDSEWVKRPTPGA